MLPQKSKYKSIEGKKCTKDQFELFYALKEDENGVEYTFQFCPRCFHINNYGEFKVDVEDTKEKNYHKVVEKEIYNTLFGGMKNLSIKSCNSCKVGDMLIWSGSNKTQALVCNNIDDCMNTIKLGDGIKSIQRQTNKCDQCSANNQKICFDKNHPTNPGYQFTGCVFCNDEYRTAHISTIGKNIWKEKSKKVGDQNKFKSGRGRPNKEFTTRGGKEYSGRGGTRGTRGRGTG